LFAQKHFKCLIKLYLVNNDYEKSYNNLYKHSRWLQTN